MTFDSLTFAVFLIVVFAAYWLTPGWTVRKVLLLVTSYVFYAFWNPFFVALLVATTAFDWLMGRALARTEAVRMRKLMLAGSIVVNLGALGFFKYAQFFADTAVDLARTVGVTFQPMDLGILLPVGISFYTFESVSYVIDVYRRKVPPSRSFLDYGLYVTFFPHLVAGPILRYGDFSPQCIVPKRFAEARIGLGAALLVIGLTLKVAFADLVFAPVSDKVFGAGSLSVADAWIGAASFSFQVYCDFAGYSLCAIGTALMFGFRFPSNFESPFGSIGIAELWTRWHISLSTWLRDYVFIPLGGYRNGRVRGAVNVMITFVLCGLWHGAAWTYVVWGAVNGAFIVAERIIRDRVWDFTRTRSPLLPWLLAFATFGLFTLAVVFFRAQSLGHAGQMLLAMAGGPSQATGSVLTVQEATLALVLGACVLVGHRLSVNVKGWDWLDDVHPAFATALLACAIFAIVSSPGLGPAFIYFQF